jgi:hypothetical protein
LNPLSPGDRFFPDRVVPEPIIAEVSGDMHGDMAGGGTEMGMECGYRNASDRMVILRCLGPNAFFLERVVFPFELLSFACPADSEVEIFTHCLGGPELLEAMPARAWMPLLPWRRVSWKGVSWRRLKGMVPGPRPADPGAGACWCHGTPGAPLQLFKNPHLR